MKMNRTKISVLWALVMGMAIGAGCKKKSQPTPEGAPGFGERTGAALDEAAEDTGEAVKSAATATKEFTGKVIEKTGDALKTSGNAAEKTGADMQK